jgi:hypothetical protein
MLRQGYKGNSFACHSERSEESPHFAFIVDSSAQETNPRSTTHRL